jgi:hypothetical protein
MVAAPMVYPSGELPVRAAIPAARPGAVLDHERLAKNILEALGENSSQHVGGAAGRVWYDDAHRVIGPTGVFAARASHSHCADGSNRCQDLAAAWQSAARLH